ncbi:MAG: bacillithiol biosynthesis cysteine-adding enzyme BshC [Desulfotomaculum sp.]|nr:bacillithiol biosynthesis cysteine-adding enzyme BshC [Desulfotomaculum sp.]
MELVKEALYYQQPTANRYLLDFKSISHLYDYNPYINDSYSRRLKSISGYPSALRRELSSILKDYNKKIGAGYKTLENIKKISHNAVIVMTGQQPGFLTGPLYTVYKALAACLLAERLNKKLHIPVVPVFWIGSEDHDFREINHVTLPGRDEPVRLEIYCKNQGYQSVGNISLTPGMKLVLEQVIKNCPGEHQQVLADKLFDTFEDSNTLGQWFAVILAWLFRDLGLVLADALLPGLRRIQAPFFYRAVLENKEVEDAFCRGYYDVASLGLKPQVKYEPGHSHIFFYYNGQRTALFRNGDSFRSRDGKLRWHKNEMLLLAETEPQLFSPNVVLKPVAVEMMFPLLAYVGGPGEISYYGMLKNIYRHYNRQIPIVYPRPGITLVEPRALKYLNRYKIRAVDFLKDHNGCIHNYLQQTQEVSIDEIFDKFKKDIISAHSELCRQVKVIDNRIDKLADKHLLDILKKVSWLKNKLEQYNRQSHRTSLNQLHWLKHRLLPYNCWQH